MDSHALQAMVRFGLGARVGEAPPGDPVQWLRRQITQPDPTRFDPAPSTAAGLTAFRDDLKVQDPAAPRESGKLFHAEVGALLANAITTPAPFRERLVWFWANHFTISTRVGVCVPVVGAFVQEAIRPYVTGRFADMLMAVMHHPAMLMYLNNNTSIGPASPAGLRTKGGLNENLARECMELHTLSPAAGYTQADVTSFAMLLTGWSIDVKADPPGFLFRPNAHQPGPQTVMGRTFPDGEAGATMALAFFAAHPATHRHLATKLVQHFVADDPPPDAVRRIEGVLRDTGGDLGQASLALIDLPGAWAPDAKLRSPQDFMFASLRCVDLPPDRRPDLIASQVALGQQVFGAVQPNGWPDRATDWAAPEALLRRIDWAYSYSGRAQDADPMQIAEAALGPRLRPATAQAIQHAGSRRDALTLLLTSPEFQRR